MYVRRREVHAHGCANSPHRPSAQLFLLRAPPPRQSLAITIVLSGFTHVTPLGTSFQQRHGGICLWRRASAPSITLPGSLRRVARRGPVMPRGWIVSHGGWAAFALSAHPSADTGCCGQGGRGPAFSSLGHRLTLKSSAVDLKHTFNRVLNCTCLRGWGGGGRRRCLGGLLGQGQEHPPCDRPGPCGLSAACLVAERVCSCLCLRPPAQEFPWDWTPQRRGGSAAAPAAPRAECLGLSLRLPA